MSFFFQKNRYEQLKNKETNEEMEKIFPQILFCYFPVAPTAIRQDEFEYISSKLLKRYKNSIKGKFGEKTFFISTSSSKVNLASNSEETIKLVKSLKERHEIDSFLKKYSFSENIRKHFKKKPCHIDFLLL